MNDVSFERHLSVLHKSHKKKEVIVDINWFQNLKKGLKSCLYSYIIGTLLNYSLLCIPSVVVKYQRRLHNEHQKKFQNLNS